MDDESSQVLLADLSFPPIGRPSDTTNIAGKLLPFIE